MKRLGLVLLCLAASTAAARAQPAESVPAEIAVPTALVEQLYGFLQNEPYKDVAPLIDGMRQAAAKAKATHHTAAAPPPIDHQAPPAGPSH